MTYFKEILTPEELKALYRRLALMYHPDKGGSVDKMQRINKEYSYLSREFYKIPRCLNEVKVGNLIFVNNTKCIVTEVNEKYFKAKSIESLREAYFSKSSGFAMLNYKFKASISKN